MKTETKSAIVRAVCTSACSAVGVMSFGTQARSTRRRAESLPVDLVSIEDFSKLTKGVKDAPKAESRSAAGRKESRGRQSRSRRRQPKATRKRSRVETAKADDAAAAAQGRAEARSDRRED